MALKHQTSCESRLYRLLDATSLAVGWSTASSKWSVESIVS